MQLRQLQYFVAVAEQLSFRKAAEILYVTQPLLSKQIADLEDEIGSPLFIRNTRSVSLTPAGEAMLEEANKLIRQSDSLITTVQNAAKHGDAYGALSIGYEESFSQKMPADLLSDFREQYPAVDVRIRRYSTNDLRKAMEKGLIDVAFVLLPDKHISKNMRTRILSVDTLALAASKRLISKEEPQLSDFIELAEQLPFCLLEKNTKGMNYITGLFQRMNVFVNFIFAETVQDMLVYAESGYAISVIPHQFLDYPGYDLIAHCPIRATDAQICLAAVWNAKSPNPAREYFIDMLSDRHVDCLECPKTWCHLNKAAEVETIEKKLKKSTA